MKKWEYFNFVNCQDADLDKIGLAGWEIIMAKYERDEGKSYWSGLAKRRIRKEDLVVK